jgi:hypothetical protein
LRDEEARAFAQAGAIGGIEMAEERQRVERAPPERVVDGVFAQRAFPPLRAEPA